jgi:hypothetical protein
MTRERLDEELEAHKAKFICPFKEGCGWSMERGCNFGHDDALRCCRALGMGVINCLYK